MRVPLSVPFRWFNATQFLGALNDNVFRLLIIIFLTDHLGADSATTVALVSLVFVLPFLLFSHAGGVLADRFSKSGITRGAKGVELVVMAAAIGAVAAGSGGMLYALLFLMCTQSALFGPTKYGIIPELVDRHALSRANSLLVSLSYLAIIIGTFLPSFVLEYLMPDNFLALVGLCVLIAAAGLATSLRIGRTVARGKRQHFSAAFVVDIVRTLRSLRGDGYLLMTVLGSAYFLFLGAFIQQNIILYGQHAMDETVQQSAMLFPMAALGIGIGALLAGRVSGRNIEFGIVPLGAAGLTVSCLLLNVVPPRFATVLPVMLLLGISSGLFIVPVEAFIQYRSPPERRGEIIACANFLSFLGVALSAMLVLVFTQVLNLTPGQGFVAIALLTGVLAVFTVKLLPDFLVRFVTVMITRTVYRIRVYGESHMPDEGGALLVSNHVTWVDALLILATQQRRIRFIMLRDTYERKRWLQPVFRLMGVIPIAPSDRPREILRSFAAARQALSDGFEVCIFAEGSLTRDGRIQPFRPGLEWIVKGMGCPVIPVYIGGAWGSWFSYYRGRVMASFPRRIPYPVSVTYGAPLPAGSRTADVHAAVCALAAERGEGDGRERTGCDTDC